MPEAKLVDVGLGGRMRGLRLERGLTLEGLAELSGLSVRAISDIERGIRNSPRRSTIDALCEAMHVDVSTRRELGRSLSTRLRTETPVEAVQPHRIRDFVGREIEFHNTALLFKQTDSLTSARTVVVSGSPGVGKTSFAIEALYRARDSESLPLYIDLLGPNRAAARSPLSVIQGLLRQLLKPHEAPPSTIDACVAAWMAICSGRQQAVLLDNAADESQVRPVLAGQNLRVIVTSRRSLAGLEDVTRLHLSPLPPKDSVRLLRLIVPSSQQTEADLVQLAELCGDLPLALRIVANRIASRPARTAADFARDLSSTGRRLKVLVAGDLSADAAFRLSYDELDPFSARVFRNLSLVDGVTFDTRLVSALINAPEPEIADCLEELVELGLLEFVGQSSYRLHDLLRSFADVELQKEEGESAHQSKARLRKWLLSTCVAICGMYDREPEHRSVPVPTWIVDRDAGNSWIQSNWEHWWPAYLRAAILGENQTVLDVAAAFQWYADTWMGFGRWHDLYSNSLAVARRVGDKRQLAFHLGYLSWVVLNERADQKAAIALADEAIVMAREANDDLALALGMQYKGWAYCYVEQYEQGIPLLRESVRLFDGVGSVDGTIQSLTSIASALRYLGRWEDAIAESENAIEKVIEADRGDATSLWGRTQLVAHLRIAEILIALDRADEAYERASQAIVFANGWEVGVARAHYVMALAARALGRTRDADVHVETGLHHLTDSAQMGILAEQVTELLLGLKGM